MMRATDVVELERIPECRGPPLIVPFRSSRQKTCDWCNVDGFAPLPIYRELRHLYHRTGFQSYVFSSLTLAYERGNTVQVLVFHSGLSGVDVTFGLKFKFNHAFGRRISLHSDSDSLQVPKKSLNASPRCFASTCIFGFYVAGSRTAGRPILLTNRLSSSSSLSGKAAGTRTQETIKPFLNHILVNRVVVADCFSSPFLLTS